jgi:hypothetical protein
MQNSEFLEFGICWPLSVEFIWEAIRYRSNQSTYYRKLFAESFQTWMKGENSMYLSNIRYFGIVAPFLNEIAIFVMVHQQLIKIIVLQNENYIKIG